MLHPKLRILAELTPKDLELFFSSSEGGCGDFESSLPPPALSLRLAVDSSPDWCFVLVEQPVLARGTT